VERDMSFEKVSVHIESILSSVHEKHPGMKPLFIMAYGKEMIPALEEMFTGMASFLFNPVLADEIAMEPAKELMEKLFHRK